MSNPVLNERSFSSSFDNSLENEHFMTINGTIIKTFMLGLFLSITFAYTWYLQMNQFADKAFLLSKIGVIGGLIMVLIICFAPKNKYLAITTSIYAMFEGMTLGCISAIANKFFNGIALQAALSTILTLFGMLFLYSTKLVKCTEKFKMVIFNSTLAVCGIYVLQIILGFFHISIPGLFSNGPVGIIFSLAIIVIAAFNLIIDFDFIQQYAGKVPKYFEWYGGFSLMVTIIWLYIEFLNLLMKLQSRDR